MDMPKPSPNHEKLHVFAGDWEGVERMMPSPMGPGGDASGTMTGHVEIDGFFVVTDYAQQVNGVTTYRGHGVYGFDMRANEYTWYWVDSMAMASAPSRGKWERDTLMFESSHPGGMGRYSYRWEVSPIPAGRANVTSRRDHVTARPPPTKHSDRLSDRDHA